MIKYRKKLDMVSGNTPMLVYLNQYDSDVKIVFELYASDGSFSVESGTTVAIRGTKPDGNGISIDGDLVSTTDEDTGAVTHTVTVQVDQQMTAVAGRSFYELTLFSGDKELNTANFVISVERAALDKDTVVSGSVVRELVEIMDNSDQIIAAAAASAEAQETIEQIGQEVRQAKEDAEEAAETASNAASAAGNTLTTINNAVEEGMEQINERATQIAQVTTSAEQTAMQALDKASDAENEVAEFINSQTNLNQRLNLIDLRVDEKVDGAFTENGYLYLTSDGEVVAGPLGPFSGTGGGGSGSSDGNNAKISVSNDSGWNSKTVSDSDECIAVITWDSLEDDNPTGNGTLTIMDNGATKAMLDIPQGTVSIDLMPYVITGSNVVSLKVEDIYGNSRTLKLSVTVVTISLASSFDSAYAYTGPISFPYTPVGNTQKTMHFLLDSIEIGSTVTSVSGRQQSFTIAQQTHGVHTFEAYFDCTINGQVVESNHLYYEIICLETLNNDPIIASNFKGGVVKQYSLLQVPFIVYVPTSQTADVLLQVDGETVSARTVDRSEQTWVYRADTVGNKALSIAVGAISKTIPITVEESDIEIYAETDALSLYLTSYGRSNSEADPGEWASEDISATLTNFNFTSDGWVSDQKGVTVLRVSGDDRVAIPAQPFAVDARTTGKTIGLEFATHNVMDYDAKIISCESGGRGFYVTPQRAVLKSEQSEISMQFKEDEHVSIYFVIEKRSENRLVYCYVNGIISGAIIYPTDDDFSQVTPVGISIGSNDAVVDLYNLRIYDNDLTRHQVLTNWIADTQDVDDMLDRYMRNSVYDEYGNIVISKLPKNLPYMILEADELPQYKGDKKTVSGSYVNPATPSLSFTFEGAQFDVQGTSSAGYARKNYKGKFKAGFDMSNGSHVSTYAFKTGYIPTHTFCFKADVASSEGANNVKLAGHYNDICTYKTPAQVADSQIRQGIDGIPIVIFWHNTVSNETSFVGKYNFNYDKGTEDVYGLADPDESWEMRNNTSARVLYKSADYTSTHVDENGNTVLLVEDAKTHVEISKVDVADGEELEGATIQILDSEGNVVDEWVSSKDETHVVAWWRRTRRLHGSSPASCWC